MSVFIYFRKLVWRWLTIYFVCGSVADSALKLFKVLGDIVPLCISYNQGVEVTDNLFKSNIADGMQ